MYYSYYVNQNAQVNGDHEVHKEGCTYMPINKLHLGAFSSCQPAVESAKRVYPRADGCYWCSRECHTR